MTYKNTEKMLQTSAEVCRTLKVYYSIHCWWVVYVTRRYLLKPGR